MATPEGAGVVGRAMKVSVVAFVLLSFLCEDVQAMKLRAAMTLTAAVEASSVRSMDVDELTCTTDPPSTEHCCICMAVANGT